MPIEQHRLLALLEVGEAYRGFHSELKDTASRIAMEKNQPWEEKYLRLHDFILAYPIKQEWLFKLHNERIRYATTAKRNLQENRRLRRRRLGLPPGTPEEQVREAGLRKMEASPGASPPPPLPPPPTDYSQPSPNAAALAVEIGRVTKEEDYKPAAPLFSSSRDDPLRDNRTEAQKQAALSAAQALEREAEAFEPDTEGLFDEPAESAEGEASQA